MIEYKEQPLVVSCLGRPLQLGMLYDCRSDQLVAGETLWDSEVIQSKRSVQYNGSSNFKVITSDSLEEKAHSMDIEANIKLSFLMGMVQVEGAAKYLDNKKSSASQARVSMTFGSKTFFEQLTMEQLATENIKYKDVFDKSIATHVVVGIEYGADAVFVFDRNTSSGESVQHVEGKLKPIIDKIKTLSVNASANVDISENERQLANSFTCTFHGDVILEINPITFDDALSVYCTLPAVIRNTKRNSNSDIYGAPKKMYLYPLSKLDNRAAKLVRIISENVVTETQNILENLHKFSVEAADLEKSSICQRFTGLQDQMQKFRSLLHAFRSSFQRILCELLLKIRGGGAEESKLCASKLSEVLIVIQKSPFSTEILNNWINIKKREFACIQAYLEILQPFTYAFNAGELEKFTQSSQFKNILCFSLGKITSRQNAFLDNVLTEFSSTINHVMNSDQNQSVDDHARAWDSLDGEWVDDEAVTTCFQNQMKLFRNFAEANRDDATLKFVVICGVANKKSSKFDEPGAISLFAENGRRQLFQPLSAPENLKLTNSAENSLTISWTEPEHGKNSIEKYVLQYDEAVLEIWSHEIETVGRETTVTIEDLDPDKAYKIRIFAVSKAGRSQFSEIGKFKTKLPPPLSQTILPFCVEVFKEEKRKLTWYQLPIVETYRDAEKKLLFVDVLRTHNDDKVVNKKERKVILLVGETGSGKTTLINGLINHIYGVTLEDKFRFQLIPQELHKKQSVSQTMYITGYTLHWQQGSRIPYTITIIDTPGYGDTEGLFRDQAITSQIQGFFEMPPAVAVDQIDAVGLVVKACDNKLTHTRKYIFQSIFGIFGNDIAENIFLLLTYADLSDPPALSVVRDANIPFKGHFKFNNSLFAYSMTKEEEKSRPADQQQQQQQQTYVMNSTLTKESERLFWDFAHISFKDFFSQLLQITAKSLTLTRVVLQERQQLHHCMEMIQQRIENGVNQLALMTEELKIFEQYSSEKNANKEYVRYVDVPTVRKTVHTDGRFVTNCLKCHRTCHLVCKLPLNTEKYKCLAMNNPGDQNTTCRECPQHCKWDCHDNMDYYYEPCTVTQMIKAEDLKQKYDRATKNLSDTENILMGISEAYLDVQEEVLKYVTEITGCIERLNEISMMPDPLSTVEYIKILIKTNQKDKKSGYEKRIEQLESALKRAEMIKKMKSEGKNYDPFEDLKKDILNEVKKDESVFTTAKRWLGFK